MTTKRKDINELKKMVSSITNGEYTLESESYINQHQKLLFSHKCKEELHKFEMKWKYFQKGCRCIICEDKRKSNMNKKDMNWFIKRFNELADCDNYDILSKEYIDSKTKLLFKCKLCNTDFKITWNDLQQGHRCGNCKSIKLSNEKTHTYKYVKDFIDTFNNCEYEMLSKTYISNEEELDILHKKCKKISKRSFKDFQQNKCCKNCIPKSKGEMLIEHYLKRNNISYETQFRFNDLRNKLPLPFDFIVYSNDNNIILIEFDGIQHYKPVKKFGGEEGFRQRKINDNLKNIYCKSNNLVLIRIPYFKMNKIDEILNSSLNK